MKTAAIKPIDPQPTRLHSRHRWAILVLVCLVAAVVTFNGLGWEGWVSSWLGTCFKAVSGGAIGALISRYVVRLDISSIREEQRPVAAITMAILTGAFAIAVALGS